MHSILSNRSFKASQYPLSRWGVWPSCIKLASFSSDFGFFSGTLASQMPVTSPSIMAKGIVGEGEERESELPI